jgi:hypothetical protein
VSQERTCDASACHANPLEKAAFQPRRDKRVTRNGQERKPVILSDELTGQASGGVAAAWRPGLAKFLHNDAIGENAR